MPSRSQAMIVYSKDTIPKIVVLCGSARFKDDFLAANQSLTAQGFIVLMPGFVADVDAVMKTRLDNLHKRKIDLADEVYVINRGGYVGESTRSEIEYATKLDKVITYKEQSQ